jgi:hypothetical protein
MLGAVPACHFTLLGQDTLLGVPSAVKIIVKPIETPEVDGTFDMVRVLILELRAQLNKLQVSRFITRVFDEILIAETVSVYLLDTCKDSTTKFPVGEGVPPVAVEFMV